VDGPRRADCDLVVVGCSWGGTRALATILAGLPADVGAALAVVLHRGPGATDTALPRLLARRSPIPVEEAEDKTPVEPGHVFLAPPDYHLLVDGAAFALSTDEPVNHSRPSLDVLFESAADSYGPRLVAIVLTGANEDGAAGVRKVKERGGRTIVQDPDDAERRTMPEAAVRTGAVDEVLPLSAIAERLRSLIAPTGRHDGGR
jgi:two-component system chemotaxis response regulator CheB